MHAREPLVPVSKVTLFHLDKRATMYAARPMPANGTMRTLARG